MLTPASYTSTNSPRQLLHNLSPLPMPHISTWTLHIRILLNCSYSNTINFLKKYLLEIRKENGETQLTILDLSIFQTYTCTSTDTYLAFIVNGFPFFIALRTIWGDQRSEKWKANPVTCGLTVNAFFKNIYLWVLTHLPDFPEQF